MKKDRQGFTLVEVLVAVIIIATVVVGMIELFIYSTMLSESTRNLTSAFMDAQSKMEEIRNHTYSLITTDYASGGTPGNTFDLSTLTGKGVIYIDSSNSSLLQITIVVCWENSRTGRIIGEDLDLDGTLDAGEDLDSDSQIDSPAKLISYIAYR